MKQPEYIVIAMGTGSVLTWNSPEFWRKNTSTASMVWAGLGHGYCPDMPIATKKSPTWNIGSIFLKFVKYLFLQQESILFNEVALFPNDHIFSLKNLWKTDPKMPWNGFLRNDKMFSVKVRRAHGSFKTKVFCWEFLRDIGGADLVKLQFKGVLLIGKFVATCGFWHSFGCEDFLVEG